MLGVRPLRAALFQRCFKPKCQPRDTCKARCRFTSRSQDRVYHHHPISMLSQISSDDDPHDGVSMTYEYSSLFQDSYDPGTLFVSR